MVSATDPVPYLRSNFTLPVPVNASEPNYGGTPEAPYFFYNDSIPNGMADVVCMGDNRTAGVACCPLSIGIDERGMSDRLLRWDNNFACRMRDTPANREYWANCTRQLGAEFNLTKPRGPKEGGSASSELPCVPFEAYLGARREATAREVWKYNGTYTGCAPVGWSAAWALNASGGPPAPSIADTCCAEIDGAAGPASKYGLRADANFRDEHGAGSEWSGFDCLLPPNKQGQWEHCVARYHTWSVCNSTATALARGPRDAGFVLLAAAAALAVAS